MMISEQFSKLALILCVLGLSSCLAETAAEDESDATPQIEAQSQADSHFVKDTTIKTPLRDGINLTGTLWRPEEPQARPTILLRNPYGPVTPFIDRLELGPFYTQHGYNVLIQNVRGKGGSEGIFNDALQEEDDSYDTLAWIAKQAWSNGRVCMMGVSYSGAVQWLAAKSQSPHLDCIVPAASPGHGFEAGPYHGGAFLTPLLQWAWHNDAEEQTENDPDVQPDWDNIMRQQPLSALDELAGRRSQLFQDWLNNPVHNAYWEETTILGDAFETVDVPALHITGFFDESLPGAMHYWHGMKQSPAASQQHLLIGPWNHIQTFIGGKTKVEGFTVDQSSVLDMRDVALEFFDRHLKDEEVEPLPKVRIFVTGEDRWRTFDEYPDTNDPRRLYLDQDGGLVFEAPSEGSRSYAYDPANPAPEFSNPIAEAENDPYPHREDVLVYTSEPLPDPITVMGPVRVELAMKSDALDTDFVVRVLDVAPDGTERRPYATDGIMRARYRNGYDQEVLLTPGVTTRLGIDLFDVAYRFEAGHRIRLHVTSSVFPFIYPNSNTGNPVATDTESAIANQTVLHGGDMPSFISLPIVESR